MALITLKEFAERNGRSADSARQKANRGGFRTAQKIGRDWLIDEDEHYSDNREKSGEYKKLEKKAEEK